MDYRSAKEAAERWGVSLRVAQSYCKAGRVPGARKYGVSWVIPADAEKPMDPRKARKLLKAKRATEMTTAQNVPAQAPPAHTPSAHTPLAQNMPAQAPPTPTSSAQTPPAPTPPAQAQPAPNPPAHIPPAPMPPTQASPTLPTYHFFTSVPLPKGAPEAALNGISEALRPLAEADLAFRRGNPEPAKALWAITARDDETKLSVASLATAAAISSGDYALYGKIRRFLQRRATATKNERDKRLLSLPGVLAAVSMAAPSLTPDWLKHCDFALFPAELHPFLLFLHAMHLRNLGEHAAVLAAARATLTLCAAGETFTWLDAYLTVLCAAACYALGEEAQAERYVNEALALAMPYGIIAPFADYLGKLGGTPETLMKRQYPQYVRPTIALWEGAFKNWTRFHNAFMRDNLTTLLTPREYQTAYLVACGESYAGTARRMNLSVSRVKHLLEDVYAKLCIQNKRELSAFLL